MFAFGLLDGELNVHQSANLQCCGEGIGGLLDLFDDALGEIIGWQHAGRIARVYAGLFDVFHDSAHQRELSVRNRIDIHFDRVFQKLVDQDWPIRRRIHRLCHVASNRIVVIADFHGTAAENITRTDQHRIADFIGDPPGSMGVGRGSVGRLPQSQTFQDSLEPLAIFRGINHVRAGANNVNAGGFETTCQIERRLTAELHNHPVRLHPVADVEHIFGCERFEEQKVRRVVVR